MQPYWSRPDPGRDSWRFRVSGWAWGEHGSGHSISGRVLHSTSPQQQAGVMAVVAIASMTGTAIRSMVKDIGIVVVEVVLLFDL